MTVTVTLATCSLDRNAKVHFPIVWLTKHIFLSFTNVNIVPHKTTWVLHGKEEIVLNRKKKKKETDFIQTVKETKQQIENYIKYADAC